MRKIFPAFAVILGAFWVFMAIKYYPLWIRRGPGGGFFPLIGGLLAAIFGLFYLVDEIRIPKPGHVDKKFCYPILAILAVLFASDVIGILPAMLLYIFLWLWRYEKYAFRLAASVSAGVVACLYGVFVYWLSVPLPKGMLHEMIFG